MSAKVIHTEVDGRKLKLTNLDKIIYPSTDISKAQIIEYYLTIGPEMLEFIRLRPLTMIRFPDGIDKHKFYSKSKPEWTPDWIQSIAITHDKRSIDYLYLQSIAGLIWTANLAALELHPMAYQVNSNSLPDYMVFDLDPDESITFNQVKLAAIRLREIVESKGYSAFLKTSGGKGLHILVPLEPKFSFEQIKECCKSLAQTLINKFPGEYTLEIPKAKRKGKVLIDIYRNHETNTIVAPYSLRGKGSAPISMPLKWDDLDGLSSSQKINLSNYAEYLDQAKDAWSTWKSSASPILLDSSGSDRVPVNNDERLQEYVLKRDLDNTPEPMPMIRQDYKDKYAIQFHDASNLHYDLRLEHDGVLWSWAIPKGLPTKKGQKRLAIRTEDHPVAYLNFEGVIPKGAYGAGQMWTLTTGDISWHTKSEKKLAFTIDDSKYYLVKGGDADQWIMTVADDRSYLNLHSGISPMLANQKTTVPNSTNYTYEVKWDGIRVLIYLGGDEIKIYSRSGRDISGQFRELLNPSDFRVEEGIFDGEIVVLDINGKPVFGDVISRMHKKQPITKLGQQEKTVSCYLFDTLSIDGFDLIDEPLYRRRALLKSCLRWSESYRFSNSFDDGQALYDAIESKSMEGIMAKDKKSRYHIGVRSNDWFKIKIRKEIGATIIGYTAGKGDRSGLIGSLHIQGSDGSYLGKVGTGFDHNLLKDISEKVMALSKIDKPIEATIEEAERTTWIDSNLNCIIQYASMTPNGTLREPVFLKLKMK